MTEPSPLSQRLRAAELFAADATQADVARELGVTRTTAMRWHRIWLWDGRLGLARAGRRGRPPKLDGSELTRVLASLPTSWSIDRVADELFRRTGIRYHPGHLSRVLKAWGWAGPGAPRPCLTFRDPEGHAIYLSPRP